jgi:dolichol-phosphate mannosyltransferase
VWVSVVLPTYNEAPTIADVVREVVSALSNEARPYEVLVVDDESPDGTADVLARAFAKTPEVRLVHRQGTRGLALSIRDGIRAARGEVVVVMDADFNHDPRSLTSLLAGIGEFDLVSGSRFVAGGGMYSRMRLAGSGAMNAVIRALVRTHVRDNLAGFFAARSSLLRSLPEERIFWGYGDYYFRLLWYARHAGAKIVEIPVVYRPREGGKSKTRFARTTLSYCWEALRFAVKH